MIFVVYNQINYKTNLSVHGLDTRSKNQSYLPTVNLSCWQRGVSCCAIKMLKNLRNKVKFKVELHKYLITHSFYSLTELFENNTSKVHNPCFNLVPCCYIGWFILSCQVGFFI